MDRPVRTDQEMRDTWNDYNRRQEFEHQLIDRKTTWLLATQTILFAAYGLTLGTENANNSSQEFRDVIAWSGVSIAAIVLIGVLALIISKFQSWRGCRTFFDEEAPRFYPLNRDGLQWGVKTKLTPLDLLPDVLLPVVFIVAWCSLAP